jgi:hypothetical protein
MKSPNQVAIEEQSWVVLARRKGTDSWLICYSGQDSSPKRILWLTETAAKAEASDMNAHHSKYSYIALPYKLVSKILPTWKKHPGGWD